MAEYLPIRSFNRSQNVRIESQKITPTTTAYVDVSKATTRKELSYHSAIGAVYIVGGISATNAEVVFSSGVGATADGSTLKITTAAGTLRNRQTGAIIAVPAATTTIETADATNPRIDLIEVKISDGTVKGKKGTAAAEPVAPSTDAGYLAVALIAVAKEVTKIKEENVTDKRVF